MCHCTTLVTIACAVIVLQSLNLPVPSHLQFLTESANGAAGPTAGSSARVKPVEIVLSSDDDDDKGSAVNSVAGLNSVKSASTVSSSSLSVGAARAAPNGVPSGPSGLKRHPSTQSLPARQVSRGYKRGNSSSSQLGSWDFQADSQDVGDSMGDQNVEVQDAAPASVLSLLTAIQPRKTFRLSLSEPVDMAALQQQSKEQLCGVIQGMCKALQAKSDLLNESKTSNRRLKRQCAQQDNQLATLREILGEKTNAAVVKKIQKMVLKSSLELSTGPSGKRLTSESTLALGIRRCFSHIAAADFGATVLFAVSQQTVCRSEVRAASASKSAFQFFVAQCMDQARSIATAHHSDHDSSQQKPWSLMGVSVRADATNSSIWRRQKLHVTEVAVGYTDSDADPDTAAEFPVHRHL